MSEEMQYKNVCHSIQAHQHAIKYLQIIENSHHTYLFISMGMLITAVSVSLLKVAENDHHSQWIMYCMFLLAQLFHVFVLTVQGQFVINALDGVSIAIYESLWYNLAPRTQLLYVLSLRCGLKPPLLTAGGLITLSLRSFAETSFFQIIKASVSYYTVMQST
ncbi:odorant receptor 33b-like [Ceratina calcarata]|uniref:Odorant receptor 33b-like n=1 Tax=Ceratina calcarata TaxID=156304 RepID=A0AAJ7S4F5_9HYME|nr:odorant receptor 33b-like [Ceratina calcarata]